MVTKEAQIQKTILINGMHCASCVSAVEKGLNNREGIQEASVNLATESAMITYDPQRISETEIDRKSTRLNSSHVSISYAVFCLKKKKKKHVTNKTRAKPANRTTAQRTTRER